MAYTHRSASASLLLLLLVAAHSASAAIDINTVLAPYPDFKMYKDLLNQFNLVSKINSQSAITLLVTDAASCEMVKTLNEHLAVDLLSMHVLLEYYDEAKLKSLKQQVTAVPTLFQTLDHPNAKIAVMNITVGDGGFQFGSSVPGSQHNVPFKKQVVAQASTVSVLQLENLVLPAMINDELQAGGPGNQGSTPSSPSPPATPSPATPAPAQTKTPPATPTPKTAPPSPATPALAQPKTPATPAAPTTAPTKSPSPSSGGAGNSAAATTPTPSASTSTPPTAATTPAASTPASTAPTTATTPSADSPTAGSVKAADSATSGAGKSVVGGGVGVAVMAAAALLVM